MPALEGRWASWATRRDEEGSSNGLAARPARPDAAAFGSNSQAFANWTLQRTDEEGMLPPATRRARLALSADRAPPIGLRLMGEPTCQVEVLGTTSPTEMRKSHAARQQVPGDSRSRQPLGRREMAAPRLPHRRRITGLRASMGYPPYAHVPKDAENARMMERPQVNGRSNAHATTPIACSNRPAEAARMHAQESPSPASGHAKHYRKSLQHWYSISVIISVTEALAGVVPFLVPVCA